MAQLRAATVLGHMRVLHTSSGWASVVQRCLLVTRQLCAPLSFKRLPEAIRQPRILTSASSVAWPWRTSHECTRPAERQAIAVDPEILIAVDKEWARQKRPRDVRNLTTTPLFPLMSCMPAGRSLC